MSSRFARLLVVLTFILVLVVVLRLLTTEHKQRTPSFESTFTALHVESGPKERVHSQKPFKKVTGKAKAPTKLHSLNKNSHRYLGFWDVLNKSYVDQHINRPWTGSYQCKDVICSEFLNKRDWFYVDKCMRHVKKKKLLEITPACHFMNGTSRGGVVLLSFPGSGNTWMRKLLERATGICTGSVYYDGSIWHSGSVGEGIRSSNVLVVKSHNVIREWTNHSINDPDWMQAAILIVRNPFDAIISYYKWKLFYTGIIKAGNNSHVSQINPKLFKNHSLWDTHFNMSKAPWAGFIKNIVLKKSSGRPYLVVRYENVKRNRTMEVLRILDFLNVSYSPQEVKQRLLEDVTTFQRGNQAKIIDPYTPEQRELVRDEVQQIIASLKQENDGDTLGLEEYLNSD